MADEDNLTRDEVKQREFKRVMNNEPRINPDCAVEEAEYYADLWEQRQTEN